MRFTIITACYRGSKHLPHLYETLKSQHAAGWQFEWILVDDFSNDENQTVSLIREYAKTSPFPTKAIYFEKNYYGSRSVSEAIKIARGDYVILLDQDDSLTSQALSIFSKLIDKYSHTDKFAGVCGRCVDLAGRPIGTPFKWQERLSNDLEIRHVYKIRGELFQCTRREIIAKYFREAKPGYTNGWAWTRIARHYQYVYTSSVVRIYNTTNLESLSNSKKINHVENVFELYLFYVRNNVDYLRKDLRSYLVWVVHCIRFAKHSGIDLWTMKGNAEVDLKLLTAILYPIGTYLAKQDCRKGRVVAGRIK